MLTRLCKSFLYSFFLFLSLAPQLSANEGSQLGETVFKCMNPKDLTQPTLLVRVGENSEIQLQFYRKNGDLAEDWTLVSERPQWLECLNDWTLGKEHSFRHPELPITIKLDSSLFRNSKIPKMGKFYMKAGIIVLRGICLEVFSEALNLSGKSLDLVPPGW